MALVTDLKSHVISEVESREDEIRRLSLDIYHHPELGFEERYASHTLAKMLKDAEYEVKEGVACMETAFRADLAVGSEPCVALVTEYDALDLRLADGSHKVCHACGHNLNVGAAMGAALALASLRSRLRGNVTFIGAPFEEGGGGKILMLQRGALEGIQAAMAWHGDQRDWYTVAKTCTSTKNFVVKFVGNRPSSMSAHDYVDPNDALSFFLLSLDILERNVTPDTKIQRKVLGNIEPPNVHALEAAVEVWTRSGDDDYLASLEQRIQKVAGGCAAAVGARCMVEEIGVPYRRIVQSPVMEELVRDNIELIGRKFTPDEPSPYPFSTDMGTLSQHIPCAQLLFGIPGGFNFHTEKAVAQSASEAALNAMIDGAKVMACTVIDLFSNPALLKTANEELAVARANGFKGLPTWHGA